MQEVTVRRSDGGEATIPADGVAGFDSGLDGELLTAGSPGWDDARAVWNGMIDRTPAMIVRCAHADDVSHCVRFAREHDLLVTVRGAGHNIAGSAVADGALMIDLSELRAVSVDPKTRTATVQPGATLADVDAATQAHGLAVPTGINSTTGIAGLTLGGGFGWLSRTYGLTVDNLLSAEIVTADGRQVTASERENPDLFWAIRGGGGNFGIATAFEFRLHPVGPELVSGLIVHSLEDAPSVIREVRSVMRDAPDELTAWIVLRKAPPLPFLPEEWHGREILVIALCHAGPVADGEKAVAPLRSIGSPIADVVAAQPFAAWQQAFDPLLAPGARNYWKSHDFDALSDELVDTFVEFAGRLPTAECEILFGKLGGAINRVPVDATAYGRRVDDFFMNIHTRWQDADDDERCIAWARELFDAAGAFATGGVYVNFMPEDDGDRVRAAYGPNYDRLVEIKTSYDPTNFFRTNQNIRPAVRA